MCCGRTISKADDDVWLLQIWEWHGAKAFKILLADLIAVCTKGAASVDEGSIVPALEIEAASPALPLVTLGPTNPVRESHAAPVPASVVPCIRLR